MRYGKRGVIRPIISNRFKLNQATEALSMLKNGKILGRGREKTINPATEEILHTYRIMTKEEINAAAKKARDAYKEWKKDSDRRIITLFQMVVLSIYRADKATKTKCN